MQNKAVSYFATRSSTQAALLFSCAVELILHTARNEISDNFIAPLLVEMQEKLCGLRLAAKNEIALRGIIINLLQSFIIQLYCLYLHYIF